MKPNIRSLTEREQIRVLAAKLRENAHVYAYSDATLARIDALDVETCTKADVDAILGRQSRWMNMQRCDGCDGHSWQSVEIARASRSAPTITVMCKKCLRAALRALGE